MYQQQLAAQEWWRAQVGLGLGGLLGGLFPSSMPAMPEDQRCLAPSQLQSGLGHVSWRDLINQAITIADREKLFDMMKISDLTIENQRLQAIVEKPDWCELFERKEAGDLR